jgi:alpha-1,2-glucosyltransferase
MTPGAAEANERFAGWRRDIAILLLVVAASIGLMLTALPGSPMVDEHFHHGQILDIVDGDFERVPELTTPLGYHRSVAALARLTNAESVTALRALSALLGLSCVFLVWLYLRGQAAPLPLLRSLQVLFCPLLWPFYFLLYTDMSSLGLVLIAVNLFSAGLLWQTALVGLLMLAWRQNNIVWSALFWIAHFQSRWPTGEPLARWRQFFRRSALLATPMLAFVGFVWLNEGIALGDHAMHQIGRALHLSQIWFCLLVFWIVLLPLHLACLGEIVAWLRARWWRLGLMLALPALVMVSFEVTHPYNLALPNFHLRNGLLHWLVQDWRALLIGAAAMAWSVLTLIVTPLKQPLGRWLYPVAALALLPVELIEQRYYIVPIVLFLLLRQPGNPRLEQALLLWFIILSAILSAAIASTRFFL